MTGSTEYAGGAMPQPSKSRLARERRKNKPRRETPAAARKGTHVVTPPQSPLDSSTYRTPSPVKKFKSTGAVPGTGRSAGKPGGKKSRTAA